MSLLRASVIRRTSLLSQSGPRGQQPLPPALASKIGGLLDESGLRPKEIRDDAQQLWKYLRRTSAPVAMPNKTTRRASKQHEHWAPPTPQERVPNYSGAKGQRLAVAHLGALFPATYGATRAVLDTLREKMEPGWTPGRVVDYGCREGGAAWAMQEVFATEREHPGTLPAAGATAEYIGLDRSEHMVALCSSLLGELSQPTGHGTSPLFARLGAWQTPLPCGSIPTFPGSPPKPAGDTVAIAAFTLGEQKDRHTRRELLKSLWSHGADVLVLVERGTPAGSKIILEAREQLLSLSRRPSSPSGLEIVAPCPHSQECPLHATLKHKTASDSRSAAQQKIPAFCHFSAQVQLPAWNRQIQGTKTGWTDAKFSYVIFRRVPADYPVGSESESRLEKDMDGEEAGDVEASSEGEARIIAPPMKRSGHVLLPLCLPSGEAARLTITKPSHGPEAYGESRKARWGDEWTVSERDEERKAVIPGLVEAESKSNGLPRVLDIVDEADEDEEWDVEMEQKQGAEALSAESEDSAALEESSSELEKAPFIPNEDVDAGPLPMKRAARRPHARSRAGRGGGKVADPLGGMEIDWEALIRAEEVKAAALKQKKA